MRVRLPFAILAVPAAFAILTDFATTASASAPEKGRRPVTVEKVEYKGWKNNLKISNGQAEVIVTLDVGPRVISYRLSGGKNVFKEYDDQLGKSGESDWMIRGGHRLWTSPEDTTRTYAPDNAPVIHRELGEGSIRVTPPADLDHGIQKEMDVTLNPVGNGVTVVHRIKNVGGVPTEFGVWSLSVMAPGGVEVLPLPGKRPHPGSVKNARSAQDFAPSFVMAVWPFTDFRDPRWSFGARFITLTQDAKKGATKLGLAHRPGVVGYLNGGTLFVKRFEFRDGPRYPDGGVNFETFTNEDMLEIESLSPLAAVAPGSEIEHTEHWELHGGLGAVKSEEEIEAKLGRLLK